MDVKMWWTILVWIPLGLAIWFVTRKVMREKKESTKKPVAQSSLLHNLPAYKSMLLRYKVLLTVATVSLVVLVISSVVLTMRPASHSTYSPALSNRDIVLCLDVSGSMTEADQQLVEVFRDLTKGFKGERIGLVIFDSTAATVFPLTDDYEFIGEQLDVAKKAFSDTNYGEDTYIFLSGVTGGEGSSLIGDGLASCSLRFDKLDSQRSRSIILATDNQVSGNQIIDLKGAGALAKKNKIQVYGLNPYEFDDDPTSQEFSSVVRNTGGKYYKVDDPSAIKNIVHKISSSEAARYTGKPISATNDEPTAYIYLAFFSLLGFLLCAWRLGK